MSFKILNSEGIAIPINQLDAEAAAFWNKPVDDHQYADPSPHVENEIERWKTRQSNWYDAIGFQIHAPNKEGITSGYEDWDLVKYTLWVLHIGDKFKLLLSDSFSEDLRYKLLGIRLYLKPYFKLIDHWESKGYKPIRVD